MDSSSVLPVQFEFDTTLCMFHKQQVIQSSGLFLFPSYLISDTVNSYLAPPKISTWYDERKWWWLYAAHMCNVHQALCVIFFAFKPSYHQVAFNPFCKRDFHYLHIKRPTYLKQQKKRIGALSNFIQKKSLPFQKRMENMQLKFSSSNTRSNKQISKNEKKNVLDWLMSCYILIFSASFNDHLALYCVVYAHDFFQKVSYV